MSKCSFCDKPSCISYYGSGGLRNVCNFHYKIKCIEDIELDEPVKPMCEKCPDGILRFNGLGVLNNTVIVTFICINCKAYSTVKREIDSYFKD